MEDCWARTLGGCGSKLSREHYVSQSLWPDASIDVVGLPWCKDEPKRVGLSSLTAKILCDAHNSALSPLDAAAGAAMNTLRRVVAFKGNTPGGSKKGVRFEIDGPLLERWFLKTAIGLLHVQKDEGIWRHDGAPLRAPSERTVKWVFGLEPLNHPLGVYIAADVRSGLDFHDSVEGGALYYFDQGLIGFLFRFHGLQFLLWLADPGPPNPLHIPWKRGAGATTRDLHRHMRFIRFTTGKRTSHYVDFVWPDQPLAPWLR